MGYESKIYIIEKTNYSWAEENGMKYARVLAMFDVSKFYELSDWFRNKPDTKHQIGTHYPNLSILDYFKGETFKKYKMDYCNTCIKIVKE